jgi:diguanylate cyclase (GGDEF)-like protein
MEIGNVSEMDQVKGVSSETPEELTAEDYLAMLPPEGQQMIRDLIEKDPLTEIYNRRGLTTRIEAVAERVRSGELSQVVVVAGDIDKFKQINDQLSHKFGDDLLRMVANNLRKDDVITSRVGGDEFLMIWPVFKGQEGFTKESLEARIEKIGKSLEERRERMAGSLPDGEKWPEVDGKPAGTVSFGARVFDPEEFSKRVDEGGDVISRLGEEADQKMYEVKSGRSK